MAFYIQYTSRSGNRWYLTKNDTLSNKKKSKDVITFNSLKSAQNHLLKLKKKKRKELLKAHIEENFSALNNENGQLTPVVFDKTKAVETVAKEEQAVKPAKNEKTKEKVNTKTMITERNFDNVDDLTKFLAQHKNNALILDLEFFKDCRPKHTTEQHMKQIAGMILGRELKTFNGFIFDPDRMSAEAQLQYLKQKNITYQEALSYSAKHIMSVFSDFVKKYQIDTIISWDNRMDFKTLQDEGFFDIFDGMQAVDLEQNLAQINKFANDGEVNEHVAMNLKGFCTLLNIPNGGTWHEALSDVRMIKKVCDLYLNVLGSNWNNSFIAQPSLDITDSGLPVSSEAKQEGKYVAHPKATDVASRILDNDTQGAEACPNQNVDALASINAPVQKDEPEDITAPNSVIAKAPDSFLEDYDCN